MIGKKSIRVVGHSFGGRITVLAAHQYADRIQHAIVVDSKLGFADRAARPVFTSRPKVLYPDLVSACERFRFIPEEPPVLTAIMKVSGYATDMVTWILEIIAA